MKTIAYTNRFGGLSARNFFVLGGLLGLYYYYRRGGNFGALVEQGRGLVGSARGYINRVAPSVTAGTQSRSSLASNRDLTTGIGTESDMSASNYRASEIPTAPEDLDRMPTT